jgi:GGDEF domain-containing protein
VAERVVNALRAPFQIDGNPVSLSASIGAAMRQPLHHSADDILLTADEAMYAAKAQGKDRCILSNAGPMTAAV